MQKSILKNILAKLTFYGAVGAHTLPLNDFKLVKNSFMKLLCTDIMYSSIREQYYSANHWVTLVKITSFFVCHRCGPQTVAYLGILALFRNKFIAHIAWF